MKRKIALAILLTLLSISTIFLTNTKAKASTLSELSYSGGSNVVDKSNLAIDSQLPVRVRTIKNIYLTSNEYLFFQIYFNGGGKTSINLMYMEFFDIDGISLGRVDVQVSSMNDVIGSDSKKYVTYKYDNIPNRAFSFAFSFTTMMSDFNTDGYVMAFLGSDTLKTTYVDYVPHPALIDLGLSSVPVLEVSYDTPLSHDEIVEMLGCVDGYSGDRKSEIIVDDSGYIADSHTIMTHEITITSTDGSNESEGKFFIKVIDTIDPVITGKDKVSFPVQTTVTKEDILSQFTSIDGHDGDISSSMFFIEEYTPGSNVPRNDEVTIKSVDSSGNYTTKPITVAYYDNVAPVVSGPDTITLSYQVRKTLDEILDEYFTITDNVSSSDKIGKLMMINQYLGHEGQPGTYNVFVRLMDEANNTSFLNFNIVISDLIKPVIFIDTYSIETTTSVALSRIDFDDLLYTSGVLDKGKKYTAIVLTDTYTGHETEKGVYVYKVQYIDNESGDSIEKTFKIDVGYDTYTIATQPNKQLEKPALIGIIATSILTISGVAGIIIISSKKGKKENN